VRAARLPADRFRFPAVRSGVGAYPEMEMESRLGSGCSIDDAFLPVEWLHGIRRVRSTDQSDSGLRSASPALRGLRGQ